MFVTLNPGSVPTAVGMDEPLAQCRDDRYAPARMTHREAVVHRGSRRTEVLRRHDRLPHGPAMVVKTSVGASPAVRYRHRTIQVEADSTSFPVAALGLVRRIGDNLEYQVPNTAGREHGRVVADACKVVDVDDARPIVRRITPGSP